MNENVCKPRKKPIYANYRVGCIITLCGSILLFGWDPSQNLPETFYKLSEYVSIAKYLAPFSLAYFKLNALLFTFAGVMTLLRTRYAVLCYSLATVMFALTYDNPFLTSNNADKFLKCLYLMCHAVITATLLALKHYDLPAAEPAPNSK